MYKTHYSSINSTSSALKAKILFPILQHRYAPNGETVFYVVVAKKLLGYKDARPINHVFPYILYYCIKANIPNLTRLMINKKTSKPSLKIVEKMELKKLVDYNWSDVIPPTKKRLEQAKEEIESRINEIRDKNNISYEDALIQVMKEYKYKYIPKD